MTRKMLNLTIENTKVTLEKTVENIDAIGQVIHPLALLEIDIRLGEHWLENIKHQLDTPNEHMKFDKSAVIVDTCIRNEFEYSFLAHFESFRMISISWANSAAIVGKYVFEYSKKKIEKMFFRDIMTHFACNMSHCIYYVTITV